jgi:hypothetical protein
MTRQETLDRYRHLRAISAGHHSGALKFLPRAMILDQAKRLGLADGRMLLAESEEEMTLVFDLALYTAKEGRSRALDRYARAVPPFPGSDEALVLDTLRHARFSVWRIRHRHEIAGLVVSDVLREIDVWLMDENLEASAPEDMAFAGRICEPADFAMTCGVVVPVDKDLLEKVLLDTLAWRHGSPEQVAQEPRFAAAIYRAAIDTGLMERIAYE